MYQFTETQRFRQWWLWVLMVVSVLPIPAMWVVEYGEGKELDHWELIAVSVVPLLVLLLFFVMKLTTRIDSTGIHYRFFPFHFKERTIAWDDIDNAHVRKYKPIGEYGGWGLRYGFKYGRAINVSGDMGLQLVLKNGKKVLIGTQKTREVDAVLRDLGKE